MPNEDVYLVRSSALSYNQQGQKSGKIHAIPVPKALIACIGEVGPTDDVAATRAFCDKMRLVGWVSAETLLSPNIEPSGVEASLAQLWSNASKALKGDVSAVETENVKFKFVKVDGYVSGKARIGGANANAVVSVGTGKSKKPDGFRLALEFNPHRLGADGLSALEAIVTGLFVDALQFDRWLATARVVSIDVAVDFINLEAFDVMLRSDLGEKWSGWFSKRGRVETWSHLLPKNKRGKRPPVLRLYDKQLQLREAGKVPPWGKVPHARLERVRKQNQTPLVGIGKMKNPFEGVSVGHVGWIVEELGGDFRLFFAASRWLGLDAASKLIPDENFLKWRLRVQHGDAPFWQTDKIWTGWRDSLIEDGLWDWVTRGAKAKDAAKSEKQK